MWGKNTSRQIDEHWRSFPFSVRYFYSHKSSCWSGGKTWKDKGKWFLDRTYGNVFCEQKVYTRSHIENGEYNRQQKEELGMKSESDLMWRSTLCEIKKTMNKTFMEAPGDRSQPLRSVLWLEVQGGKSTPSVCALHGLAWQHEVGQSHRGEGGWNTSGDWHCC